MCISHKLLSTKTQSILQLKRVFLAAFEYSKTLFECVNILKFRTCFIQLTIISILVSLPLEMVCIYL